jgi:hypothetical protein
LSFPANVIPVFGSQRPYVDLNFALGSFGVNGGSVSSLALLSGFTFTRASLAMGYDATGKLTYGPNNLCLQSQTFDNASWIKAQGGAGSVPVVTANTETAPDGTMTADTVVFTLNGGTASGDISQLQQAITSPGPSLASFWAKTTDGTSKVFSVVGNGGTLVTLTITGAWQRFTAPEPLAGSATLRLRLRGSASGEGTAASASIYLWGAQLEAVTYQTTPSTYYPTTSAAYYGPRLVYDPVTLASLGILVEEARTNLLLQSQDFNTTWTATRASVTTNAITSPDGTVNADAFNEDATNSTSHQLIQSVAKAASALTYTQSVYVKKGGRDWICITNWDGAANGIQFWFNVNTGVVGTSQDIGTPFTATSYRIENAGNGWWRCITTFTTNTATTLTTRYITAPGDGLTSPATALNAVGLYLWQAQLE